jgi:hypothetical protein
MKEWLIEHSSNHYTHAGIGGTLTAIAASMSDDIVRTMICAVVGAVVSFTVSLLLKRIFKKWL